MKIIWRFGAPFSPLGYGVVTKEIVPKIIDDGHTVLIAAFEYNGPPMQIGNMTVWGTTNSVIAEYVSIFEKADYLFVAPNYAIDNFVHKNCVACGALDFEFISNQFAELLRKAKYVFAVSKHNKKELQRVGIDSFYAPWGVDINSFKSNEKIREKYRKQMGWDEDTFVIGSVGSNLASDRKNFVNLIKAFQLFTQKHFDSILYLHTCIYGSIPLVNVIRASGFSDKIIFPNQTRLYMESIYQPEMIEMYNSLDVLCIPSKGESFNLPLLEAQACEVPAIVSNTTALSEHLKGGWLIPVDDDDYELTEYMSWNAVVRPKVIAEQLELAYEAWKNKKIKEIGKQAREGILDFNWDKVYNDYWRPMLKYIDENRK